MRDLLTILRPTAEQLIEYRVISTEGRAITRFWSDSLPRRFELDRHYYFSPTLRAFRSSVPLGSWVLWADVDRESLPDLAGVPSPSAVVKSGLGFHLYWALGEFLPVPRLAWALPQLASRLGADTACAVPYQLLRVPGSFNPKPGRGPCSVVSFSAGRVYLLGAFGFDAAFQPVASASPVGRAAPAPLPPPNCDADCSHPGGAAPRPPAPPSDGQSRGFSIRAANAFLLGQHAGSLTALVASLVGSEPAGGSFVCPFHNDTKPSLGVTDERQRWHCFGCGLSGDAFEFYYRFHRFDDKRSALIALNHVARAVATTEGPGGVR